MATSLGRSTAQSPEETSSNSEKKRFGSAVLYRTATLPPAATAASTDPHIPRPLGGKRA
jgi:hypothetical protein